LRRLLALSALPLAYLFLALSCRIPALVAPYRGLAYLFNGYLVALGEKIHFAEHPGIPFTLLIGLLVRLRAALLSAGEPFLAIHLVQRHEEIFAWVSSAFPVLNALSMLAFGYLVSKAWELKHSLVAQALLFASPQVVAMSTLLKPEALTISMACLGSLFLLSILRDAVLPLFLGTVFSWKLNYLPFALLALKQKGHWKPLATGLASVAIAISYFYFVQGSCFTCPVSDFVNNKLLGQSGDSSGSEPVSSMSDLLSYYALFCICGAVVIGGLLAAAKGFCFRAAHLRSPLLVALFLFFLVGLVVAVYPKHLHYFFPALGLLPALYLLSIQRAPEIGPALNGFLVAMLIASSSLTYGESTRIRAHVRAEMAGMRDLDALLSRYAECYFFMNEIAWSTPINLYHANINTNQKFRAELSTLYPRHFLTREGEEFFNLSEDPQENVLQKAESESACLVLHYIADGESRRDLESKLAKTFGKPTIVSAIKGNQIVFYPGKRSVKPPR
jgi:hypothetical protein